MIIVRKSLVTCHRSSGSRAVHWWVRWVMVMGHNTDTIIIYYYYARWQPYTYKTV